MTTDPQSMDHRLADFLSRPLAVTPEAFASLAQMRPLAERAGTFPPRDAPYVVFGRAAHVPVCGPLCFGGGVFAWLFGMVDTEALAQTLHEAAEDGAVDTVLLEIDSPGGDVAGMADLAAACAAVKAAGKRLVAVAHDRAFSGGLWLASMADEFCVTATSQAGSIGACRWMDDSSDAFKQAGVRRVLVASTTLKAAGLPGVPITEVQAAAAGDPIALMHAAFVAAVAEGRGVSVETVQAWAESPDPFGPAIVERGMADRVVTFRGLLEELASPTPTGEQTMATNPKSAAAVKHAADKAAKAETAAPTAEAPDTETPAEETADELETTKAQLAAANAEIASLKAQLDEMTATDTGEDDAEDGSANASAPFAAFASAFAAAGIEMDDAAKVTIFDAIEDGLTPKAAVRMSQRMSSAVTTSERIRKANARPEGESTSPVAGGPSSKPESYEAGVKQLIDSGEATKQTAFVMAAKRWPDLHEAYLKQG